MSVAATNKLTPVPYGKKIPQKSTFFPFSSFQVDLQVDFEVDFLHNEVDLDFVATTTKKVWPYLIDQVQGLIAQYILVEKQKCK